MIPYEEIRETHDRSWTLKLLDMLKESKPHDDLTEIYETLEELEDPRVVKPLLSILEDTTQSVHLREASSRVLQKACIGICEGERRKWWDSSDELLKRHAILEARTSEADLLIPIASDPNHRFHLEAIHGLQFGFEEPEYQRLSINALNHPEEDVRQAAARNLIWYEPCEAEDSLVRALTDRSDQVVDEALTTIGYFHSQKIMRALSDLTLSASEKWFEDFDGVYCHYQREFERVYHQLSGESKEFFRTWLKPVEDLLELDKAAEENEEAVVLPKYPPDSRSKMLPKTAEEMIEHFSDTDSYWHDSYLHFDVCDWNRMSEKEKRLLVAFFREHHDPHIRELACRPLSLWNRGDVLQEFLLDPCSGVRKYAACYLKQVTPDPSIASSLWAAYQDVNCTDYRASETLAAYVVHAPRAGLEDLLADIAQRERRISRKSAAISLLQDLEAHAHLTALLSLLGEPPLVNWSIHTELVDYCVSQEISVPYFAELCTADDLPLQQSLAKAVPYLKPVLLKGVSYAAKN